LGGRTVFVGKGRTRSWRRLILFVYPYWGEKGNWGQKEGKGGGGFKKEKDHFKVTGRRGRLTQPSLLTKSLKREKVRPGGGEVTRPRKSAGPDRGGGGGKGMPVLHEEMVYYQTLGLGKGKS